VKYHQTWPALIEHLQEILKTLRDQLGCMNLTEEKQTRIRLAVEEIIVNIIQYAYPDGRSGDIDFMMVKTPDRVTCCVADDGIAFNPLTVKNPDTESSLLHRPVGGLGVFFIKKFVDEIKYERIENANHITLTWNLLE